jgi:5,10-methylene-tetrahydrofolate dehydrogenase/methenyl tetrahydrofolate cyclohydrolase
MNIKGLEITDAGAAILVRVALPKSLTTKQVIEFLTANEYQMDGVSPAALGKMLSKHGLPKKGK